VRAGAREKMDYSRFIFNPSLSASTGYTSYAVVHQTGRFTRYTAESPAAAWYFFSSFFKKIHNVNFFEIKSGFLPPYRRRNPATGGTTA
jgi:hypothetical protein